MIGSLTKCIAEFLRNTEVVKENSIPVYTANTVEGRFTVNTSLPAILVTVAPSENPTVFISGNILDSIIIHIRYMDDLLNYTMSEDDGIYEERRNWAYLLRDELWNGKQSSYFKQFMNVNGLNIMYKGMSTYTQVGVLENLSKDIDVFSFIFSCNLFSDQLSIFPTVPLEEFFITLEGAHGETPEPTFPTVRASGEKFVIWNSVEASDKVKSYSIHGKSYQEGTPTPLAPIEVQSVGDNSLLLQTGDSKESVNKTIDVKKAIQDAGHDGILRSVNGIYDEIVYDGNSWKLIQRIGVLDNIPQMGTLFKDVTYTDKQLFRFHFRTSAPENFCASGQILSNILITATGPAMDKQPLNSCWSQYSRGNIHYIYFNAPLECSTVESALEYIGTDYQIYYPLFEPQEYPLDLPVIPTYSNETWISTKKENVNPRIVMDCEVSEILDYIRDGLIAYYTGRGRSNTDENKNILPDLSGNGNDLENKNFAYTPDSGYGDGYIQYDGVDDYSMRENTLYDQSYDRSTVCVICSGLNELDGTVANPFSINIARGVILEDSRKIYIDFIGLNSTRIYNKYCNTTKYSNSNEIELFDSVNMMSSVFMSLTQPNIYIGENRYIGRNYGKCRIHDLLYYIRELSIEEIEHNYKASLQYNGMTL